ncbi:MAG: redoxin domain-containing protein [Phycisphaerales bacterium]
MANEYLRARETPIGPGEPAPDFTLLDQDRKEWTLSEAVKAGDVVLCFFPLAFTGVCGTEMKCITSELEGWKARGARVVGVSCDSFAALKAWAEKEGFRHTLLSDMHRQVCRAYGLYWPELNVAARGTVVIARAPDGKGRVKWSQRREPKVAMEWNAVIASLA